MKITMDEVEHVARLARIHLKKDEKTRFSKELNSILGYMDLLSDVDTAGIEPTVHTQSITNALRGDKRKSSQTIKQALSNAPSEIRGMFSVPKVIE